MMTTKTSSSQIKIILFVMLINDDYTSLHFLRRHGVLLLFHNLVIMHLVHVNRVKGRRRYDDDGNDFL
jgi:hypothetical protein